MRCSPSARRGFRGRRFFVRRRGRAGGGVTMAKIERNDAGAWSVTVRPHEQSPAEMAELAEQVNAIVGTETAPAAGVILGRRLAGLLTPEEAKSSERAWLEGMLWASARNAGLDWDRWQSAAAAEILRTQPGGWERAVARVVAGATQIRPARRGDPCGRPVNAVQRSGGDKPRPYERGNLRCGLARRGDPCGRPVNAVQRSGGDKPRPYDRGNLRCGLARRGDPCGRRRTQCNDRAETSPAPAVATAFGVVQAVGATLAVAR